MNKTTVNIPVRTIKLELEQEQARHWLNQSAFETQLFNALSLILPRAERFANECVKAILPLVENTELRIAARGFIGQEASHSFIHEKCNKLLTRQGLKFAMEWYSQYRLKRSHWLHVKSRMALTSSWEHFTGIICEHSLKHSRLRTHADEPFRSLWLWHCAEELEHQSLAHDLYKAANGGYIRKILIYLYGSLMFASDLCIQVAYNLYLDRSLLSFKTWMGGFKYLFGRHGLIWFSIPRWIHYFQPGFSPSRYENSDLVQNTLSQLDQQLRVIQ